MPSTSQNFEGIGNGFTGPAGTFPVTSAPPDPNAAVGPNHIVEMVNTDIAVFNKSGTAIYGPVPTNTIWNGFGGDCESTNDGDGTAVYDRISDRWVLSQFSVANTPYLECVAVSTTGDPTGTYNRYSFRYNDFPDYPKLSVWPDAYYVTYNNFARGITFSGGEVCALDRAQMLAGGPANQQCFNVGASYGGLLASDLNGTRLPPAGEPNTIVSLGVSTNDLATWRFHVDWTTPGNTTLTGPTSLTVGTYSAACGGATCIPQAGTSQQLDSLADRLMYRLAYRNFGDHESLVVNHSVTVGSGVGLRWYELRLSGGSASVFQQGTYAPDSSFRWMGSIAQDAAGDMALGFSLSSSSLHPQIHYTGRLAGDPAGQMSQGEGTIMNGAGSQSGSSLSRWGDYTSMNVDPTDDCTFVYTNQYQGTTGAFNWNTRIGSFKFPACGGAPPPNDFSIAANPTSLSIQQGFSGTSAISTAVTSGSAGTISLTAAVSPAGPTASLSPTSVTAGSASTLTVNVGTSVATGTYTVTVAGAEGSAAHSTNVTVTVTAPPPPSDFSIAANPTSLSIQQGASGTSAISTVVVGSAGIINLTASVSPAGPTASLSPTSVTAGNSSTLTVNVGASVAAGTYTVTVTGAEGPFTHSASVSLTVTAPLPGDFSISANPTSISVVQGSSGSSTISTVVVGSAGTINLTASVSPAGPTAGLSPTSLPAGTSSTLTVNVGASVAAGTYTVTVTGAEGSATHSTNVTVTVTAPPPPNDFSIAANPASLSIQQGASGTSAISTAVVGSAGTVNLTASVSPAGPTAGLSPTSLPAGTSSTLTVNVGASVAAGTYTVTVTGAEGSFTHSASVSVTVTAPPPGDFSISANPTSISVVQGSSGTSTISTAVVGSAGTVNLTASVSPAGPTAGLSPTSLPAGTSSTLTVNVGASVVAGTYTVTVTGTEGSFIHSASVTVTVTAATGGTVNGDFETGNFTGWTTTGSTGVITSPAPHSGTYSARVGSITAFNGDSSIAQTFAAPAAGGSLSFWYDVHCTDTVTYDWATATLKDNTTGTTTTVLPKTCTNSNTWSNGTVTLSGGHSYTLTLVNHDDNYASDPTYTQYDDITIGAPPANDFSIAANPTSLSIQQGGSGTSTINTAVTSGSAGTVSLIASVSPAGPTVIVSPTSVTAGGSSTLTASVGSSVATGSYTVTVTGTEGAFAHSTTVTVMVTAPAPPNPIVNGGFETGTLSGWTSSGATGISTSSHAGTYAAAIGSTSPFNGDSSIAQTFTAPIGSTNFGFWYRVVCPDTVTYDWATATLRDNTAGATTTVLPRTCNNSNTWVQVSAAVTPGHSYTITMINHDDNYAGDPTYTLYDDVSVR